MNYQNPDSKYFVNEQSYVALLPVYILLLLQLLHPFNGLFSRTTWVSQHQKGKPFWVAVESAGPYANHLHLAPAR